MYHYTDEDKERIRSNPINRWNARHVAELVRYAQADLARAQKKPVGAERDKAIAEATAVLDERVNKYNLYKDLFPELFR